MWIYLLKFSACLAILLLFYKLVLEKVHIHHFKRYYLLSAFIISLIIPFITFTQYVTISAEPTLLPTYIDQNSSNPIENKNNTAQILPIILWGIYALGAFIFAIKFLKNLRSIIKNIRNNPKLKSGGIHHVLLQEIVAPHTFFSYIFFNKKNYEAHKIPQEVFWHEETHATQKHSLDILLLELIQIVFWFHPLVYWAKHLAKLNHEFLADQAVLKRGACVPNYQKMVLAFSSNAVAPLLANAIHYSSIKKRIVIMKTQTSKKAIWLRSLLLLPLMALLLYSFSTKEILEIHKIDKVSIEENNLQEAIEKDIEQEKTNDSRNQKIPIEEILIAINKNGKLLVNAHIVKIEDLKSHLLKYNQGLTKEEREQSVRAIISVEKETPNNIIKQVDAILMHYGVATIDIKGPTPSQTQVGATKSELQEFNTLAKKYNAQPQETRVIPLKDLKTLETIYSSMTDEQKKNAQPFPECPLPPPPAPAPNSGPAIKLSPNPPDPKPSKTKIEEEEGLQNNNQVSKIVKAKLERTKEPSAYYGNLYNLPQLPPQPHPNPVEYIKELAEKGATFYIGPHQYKTIEAIKLVRKSKDARIDVSNYPIVKLGGC